MYKIKLMLLALTGLFSFCVSAQNYLMDGSPINDCQGSFFDSGGSDAAYTAGEDLSTLICGEGGVNSHVRLNFFEVNLGQGDSLRFYDGIVADPALQIIPAETSSNLGFAIQATVANSSGCILVVFSSDGTEEGSGWRADLGCTPACQTISSSVATDPPAEGIFIDICPGDTVNLTATPSFPQNELAYQQIPQECSYFWYFSDGESATGQQIERVFEQPGGHRVRLDVVDIAGCTNSNFIDLVARVAPSPAFILSGILDTTYCWGDTIVLHTLIDQLPEVPGLGVFPVPVIETSGLTLSDSLLLPDGSGGVYEQSLFLNSYPNGMTFGELSDFQGIYFNMEHSYVGDLDLEVICPDGTSVFLINYPHGIGSTNFGEPYASGPIDGGNSTDITPGVGYEYFFIDDAVNGTMVAFDGGAPSYTYTTVPSEIDGMTFTYTDTYLPAGAYSPEESFDALATCPMNGEWKVRVTDNLNLDNGWIFGWGFDATVEVSLEIVDTITVESWGWEYDPAILLETLDSIVVLPTDVGLLALNFLIEDNYGCPSDTTFMFSILGAEDPACLVSTQELLDGDWQVYPNPTQGQLTVVPSEVAKSWQYTIYTAAGQVLRTGIHRGQLDLSTEHWPVGMYFVNIVQENKQQSWKVVKE